MFIFQQICTHYDLPNWKDARNKNMVWFILEHRVGWNNKLFL